MYLSSSESGSRCCRLRSCRWNFIDLILLLVLAIFSSFFSLSLLDMVLDLIGHLLSMLLVCNLLVFVFYSYHE